MVNPPKPQSQVHALQANQKVVAGLKLQGAQSRQLLASQWLMRSSAGQHVAMQPNGH